MKQSEILTRAREGLTRHLTIRAIDADARTVEVAFASETPVERFFGVEVLEISRDAIRLDRMNNGAAVLLDHRWEDQIGVVEGVTIGTDGVARAKLRFGNGARADEVFQDIRDGIRRHVSVGYIIHKIEVEEREAMADLVTVTDWEPFEVSIVAVPADPAVGVGRSANHQQKSNEADMTKPTTPPQAAPDQAQARVTEILELGQAYGYDALAARTLREGGGPDELRRAILDHMDRDGGSPLSDGGQIGMSDQDRRAFSLVNLIRHLAHPSAETAAQAGLELEASRAFAQRTGRDPEGVYIPPDLTLSRGFGQRAGMETAPAANGGSLVATNLLAENFVDALRNRLAVYRAGATILNGLTGNVAIPRLAGGAAHEWLPEAGASSDGLASFETISMSPKTIAVSIPISRRLLIQSTPDVENVLRNDIMRRVALGIDAAALNGDASANAPTGLREIIAANATDWATSGKPTFAEIVALETAVAEANADEGGLAYICNAAMSGHLKTTPIEDGTPYMIEAIDGTVNGMPRQKSNQAQTGDVFFGSWADLIIGTWSGLDLRADTATLAASDGLVLRAFQDVDVGVRHPESFALGANA